MISANERFLGGPDDSVACRGGFGFASEVLSLLVAVVPVGRVLAGVELGFSSGFFLSSAGLGSIGFLSWAADCTDDDGLVGFAEGRSAGLSKGRDAGFGGFPLLVGFPLVVGDGFLTPSPGRAALLAAGRRSSSAFRFPNAGVGRGAGVDDDGVGFSPVIDARRSRI